MTLRVRLWSGLELELVFRVRRKDMFMWVRVWVKDK